MKGAHYGAPFSFSLIPIESKPSDEILLLAGGLFYPVP